MSTQRSITILIVAIVGLSLVLFVMLLAFFSLRARRRNALAKSSQAESTAGETRDQA